MFVTSWHHNNLHILSRKFDILRWVVLWIQTLFIKTSHFKHSQRIHTYLQNSSCPPSHRTEHAIFKTEDDVFSAGLQISEGLSEIFSLPHRQLLEIHLIWVFISYKRERQNEHSVKRLKYKSSVKDKGHIIFL